MEGRRAWEAHLIQHGGVFTSSDLWVRIKSESSGDVCHPSGEAWEALMRFNWSNRMRRISDGPGDMRIRAGKSTHNNLADASGNTCTETV